MQRLLAIVLIVTGACAGLLVWEAGRIVRREHAGLLQQLGARRLLQLQDATRRIEQSLGDIDEDLHLAGRLVREAPTDADRKRELSVMLAVVPEYSLASIYDSGGALLLSVADPRTPAPLPLERFAAPMRATALSAQRRRPGEVEASGPLPGPDGWFRVFAATLPEGAHGPSGAIALLVDTEPVLSREKAALLHTDTRLLLIGPDGKPDPASGHLPELVTGLGGPLGSLVSAMRSGWAGTQLLTREQARVLALPAQAAVAAYAPVRLAGGSPWSMALVTSASRLAPQEQAILLRAGLWGGGALVVVAVIALALVLLTRRAAALGERLRHAEQLLRAEKLATVGVLAAGIAHEIGTPLGVVRGRAEYIAGKLGPLHSQASGMQVMMEQIDHVIRTLRQLLDFARTQPAAVGAIPVAPLIRQVTDLLRIEAERRGLAIDVDLSADLPELAADQYQAQQVLVNLVMNACDASSRGATIRVAAQVEPSPASSPRRIRLSVSDTGCGIPAGHVNQVFDPFFTTKKRGMGTGLGLTVAAQIVRNHGGHIEIDSTPGKGTCVIVLWPTARQEGPHAGQQVHPDRR